MNYTETLSNHIRKVSGFRQHQDYVGMSGIADCSRLQYDKYFNGLQPTDADHNNCLRGGVIEEAARQLLLDTGIMKPQSQLELTVLHNDIKFQGHLDGVSVDGDFMEIKSLRKDKFEKIRTEQRLSFRMNSQAQTYMFNDPANQVRATLFFFICPETFEWFFMKVAYNRPFALKLQTKALMLLNAIHFEERPNCDCNRNCQ